MENVTDFVHQVYVDPDRGAEFARLIDTEGEVRNFEYQALRKDGSSGHGSRSTGTPFGMKKAFYSILKE